MNTPSKEALEAAVALLNGFTIGFADGLFKPNTSHLAAIIDSYFEPLRKRLAEMESLLESEKATRNAIIAKGQQAEARVKELDELYRDLRVAYEQNAEQCVKLNRELGLKKETTEWLNGTTIQRARAEQAEARVAELEATCAELVTDGNAVTLAANLAKQSARVAELAGALLELSDAMHRYEADVSCEVETIPSAHCEMMRRVSDALASHDAGEPVAKYSFTAEPAKHPDTERIDWLESQPSKYNWGVTLDHGCVFAARNKTSGHATIRAAIDSAREKEAQT